MNYWLVINKRKYENLYENLCDVGLLGVDSQGNVDRNRYVELFDLPIDSIELHKVYELVLKEVE